MELLDDLEVLLLGVEDQSARLPADGLQDHPVVLVVDDRSPILEGDVELVPAVKKKFTQMKRKTFKQTRNTKK